MSPAKLPEPSTRVVREPSAGSTTSVGVSASCPSPKALAVAGKAASPDIGRTPETNQAPETDRWRSTLPAGALAAAVVDGTSDTRTQRTTRTLRRARTRTFQDREAYFMVARHREPGQVASQLPTVACHTQVIVTGLTRLKTSASGAFAVTKDHDTEVATASPRRQVTTDTPQVDGVVLLRIVLRPVASVKSTVPMSTATGSAAAMQPARFVELLAEVDVGGGVGQRHGRLLGSQDPTQGEMQRGSDRDARWDGVPGARVVASAGRAGRRGRCAHPRTGRRG